MNGNGFAQTVNRKGIRWLLVTYDTVIYIICWVAVVWLQPQTKHGVFPEAMAVYMIVGYALFIGARYVLNVYHSILRYGSVKPFARMIFADALASISLHLVNIIIEKGFCGTDISLDVLVGVSAIFSLVCLAVRITYCYVYRFATGSTPIAQRVRYLLERFALVAFDSDLAGATMRVVLEPRTKASMPINELQRVVDKFAIRGEVTGITQMNKGYINRTFRVETVSENGNVHKYTLQRINTNVFRDVEALMANYKLVTDLLYGNFHLRKGMQWASVQTLRPTKDGRSYLRDDSGCWRMMTYFDHVYSLDIPDKPEVFMQAGYAFGSFMKALEELDITAVKEVIPNFHNTKSRYQDLEASIGQDPRNRVKDVMPEIEFVRSRSDKYGMISDALERGEIPLRICHNDCNLNNILFDEKTDMPVAIIDLDTVMPSSPLYDYGDSMRIGTNTAKDDEKDLSKVSCDLNLYEQYARGYLKACGDVLTRRELELLPYASLIITAEDGIRFLMDHIDGDTYYTIYYPGQNLDRARTQLKLVEDMEKKLPQIKQILRNIYGEMGLKAEI